LLQFQLNTTLTAVRPYTGQKMNFMKAPAVLALVIVYMVTAAGCQHGHSSDSAATVNSKPILRSDLEARLQDSLGESHQQPSREQADIARLNIVRDLIYQEILMQRAAKLNLSASDDEIDSRLDEIKAPYTQEEFKKMLADRHMTLDSMKSQIRVGKTEEKLFNKEINSKINITDADIASYYNTHQAEFNLIEPQYHLAEIAVTSVPAPTQQVNNLQHSKAMKDADARKKIQLLHNQIESGEDFGMLAANFSERQDNAQNGGDMGFLSESQLRAEPEVYAAINKVQQGQVTDVLPLYETTSSGMRAVGYAIYRLIDKEAAGQRQLNDPRVQQAIRKQLRDARSQLLQNAYIEILRDQARVENYFAEQIFKNNVQ
jgi:peptidyl-prolyl cis-trans isomerase SurA